MSGHVTFVLKKGPYVLVELRTGGSVDGRLMFPGGAIEEGERPFRAFLREVEEELGVLPTITRPLEHPEARTNGGSPISTFIVEKWLGKLPVKNRDDGSWLFWVPAEALTDHDFESMRIITKAVLELG